MSDFQNEMNRVVQGFVAQISELARRAAIDTLESAFGGKPTRTVSKGTAGPSVPMALAALASPGRPRGPRGAKRTADDLEALSSQVAAFVKAQPGLRIEQINK